MSVTTLYIDVENLQEIAKPVITNTVAQWPPDFPPPDVMQLYVRADQTQLWHIWASHQFPSLKIVVKGVQRYGAISKNLADMSLILDAMADFLKGRTTHIAILSDDSDYVSLFTAIKQEMPWNDKNELPFIWFLTDRPDSHSRALNDFLPSRYLHTIVYGDNKAIPVMSPRPSLIPHHRQITPVRAPVQPVAPPPAPIQPPAQTPVVKPSILMKDRQSEYEAIARAIIQRIPVGFFRSADCMKIVKVQFPTSNLSKTDNAAFGNQFAKNIWPLLEKFGVRLPNPENKPRKYEMTEEAKKNAPTS